MDHPQEKDEKILKKLQLWIAVLAGITTLIVGIYNVKNIFAPKEEPKPVVVEKEAPVVPEKIRSAVEEVGASWIKKLAAEK